MATQQQPLPSPTPASTTPTSTFSTPISLAIIGPNPSHVIAEPPCALSTFLASFPAYDASPHVVQSWLLSWFNFNGGFKDDQFPKSFVRNIKLGGSELWNQGDAKTDLYFKSLGWESRNGKLIETLVDDVTVARGAFLEWGAKLVRAKVFQIIAESNLRASGVSTRSAWSRAANLSFLAILGFEERRKFKYCGAWRYLQAAMTFVWVWWKVTLRLPKLETDERGSGIRKLRLCDRSSDIEGRIGGQKIPGLKDPMEGERDGVDENCGGEDDSGSTSGIDGKMREMRLS